MTIDVFDPVYSAPYHTGQSARQFPSYEIDRMLQQDISKTATTNLASPIVFAPKKDGSLRFSVDYQKLNFVIVKDSYRLPRMGKSIGLVGEPRILSTSNAHFAY